MQHDLDLKEDYINYLEKEIIIHDEELDPLQTEISNLKEDLKKTLQRSESQENYIDYLEKQLVIFQKKIDNLNEKINNTIDMAHPQRSHTENQAILQNYRIQQATNNIRVYFQKPNIVPTLNGITNYLNTISETGNLLEQLEIDTYNNLNNRINNAVNQINNLRTQLGALQNDYDLLNQAYRAHKLNYHLLKATCIDKKKRITELLQEKFSWRLLNRRTQKYLQDCRADKYLLEYNRDRLYK